MNRIADIILRHPWQIIIVFIGLFIGSHVIHPFLKQYDFSMERRTPRHVPEFKIFEQFVDLFGGDEDLYIIAFREEALFTYENLQLIHRITERIENLRETASITSLTNALDIRGENGSLEVAEFIRSIPENLLELAALRTEAVEHPFLVRNVISQDGTTAAFVGRIKDSASEPVKKLAYFDKIEKILEDEARGRVEFHIAGYPYMDRTIIKRMFHDQYIMMPLIFLLYSTLLWIAFRRWRAVWIPSVVIAFTSALTFGTMDIFRIPMSLLTSEATLSMLIMVIALSDSVHVMTRYEEDLCRTPTARRDVVLKRTMTHMGAAILLTSVTTGIGFFSLVSSKIRIIQDFGIFAGLGVLLAFVITVLFLPSCLALTERRIPARPRQHGNDFMDRLMNALASLVIRRRSGIIAAGLLLLVLTGIGIQRIEIDDRFTRDLKKDDPTLRSLSFLEANLSGVSPYEILVKGSGPDAVKEPRLLADIDYLRDKLMAMPYVSQVLTPVEYIKRMNQAMNDGESSAYVIPESREAVGQYLLLYEQAGSVTELDRLISYDYSVARMSARVDDVTPEERRRIGETIQETVDRRFNGVKVYETGYAPLWNVLTNDLISSLLRSLFLAIPVIFVVICITFRSVRLGLISALPNIIPLAVGLAFMPLVGISLKTSTMIAFPVAFGISVDDTIHFLARYRSEIRSDATPEEAVQRALRTTGRAVMLTTLFLVGGFAAMFVSSFLAVIHLAMILCVALSAAILGDLFLLPALLLTFRPRLR